MLNALIVDDEAPARSELRFLLDDLEARIRREVIVPMMQGVIEPSPRNGRESCRYCPAIACPRREG